jgi:nicotinate-nucleotide adenylyltransferase
MFPASGRESLGIFGGSFDPPHLGHVLCCVYARLVHALDRILVIPSGRHPFAKNFGASTEQRLEMTRLAFADLPFCEVVDLEIQRLAAEPNRPSYMIDTVAEVLRRWPESSPRLIAGTDLRGQLEQWHRAGELLTIAPPAWVPRGGYLPPNSNQLALPAWSSTKVRDILRAGESAEGIIPAQTLAFIREHGLYR